MNNRALVGLVMAVAWGLSMAGRTQAQQGQAPTFRAATDLLTLDVAVVDADGVPVTGLTASDFAVVIARQPRAVRIAEFLRFGPSAPGGAEGAAPAGGAAGSAPTGALPARAQGRVLLLLYDDLSIRVGESKGLLVAAERMLASLAPDDLVGLTTTSGRGPIVMPTKDRALLLAALRDKRLIGQMAYSEGGHLITVREAVRYAFSSDRSVGAGVIRRECAVDADARMTSLAGCPGRVVALLKALAWEVQQSLDARLKAYTQAIDAMRAAPQPRVLIVLSGGVPIDGALDGGSHIKVLSRAAASAGVHFYALFDEPETVDMRDTSVPSPALRPEFTSRGARQAEATFLFGGLQSVAESVGGTTFRVVGQADRFVARVLSETSAVYRLGIDMPRWPTGDALLPVKVTVKREGVQVRTMANVLRPSSDGRAFR